MGFERRLFARTDVEVQGTLEWATKRLVGGVKTHRAPMSTIDLSVNGAKLLVDAKVDLPVGASCRIEFAGQSSPARVQTVTSDGKKTKMLSMELEHSPAGFMRVIEQWLDARAGGRAFDEPTWLGTGIPESFYGGQAA